MNFLEKLGRALNSDEITKDVGMDLLTESLLIRAEQLARLETDKIVDKVRSGIPIRDPGMVWSGVRLLTLEI